MALAADDVRLRAEATAALAALEKGRRKEDRSIGRRVRGLRLRLMADALCGEVIPKTDIPTVLRRRHDIDNLYCIDLPDWWRLLYSVVRDEEDRVVVLVCEIVDHQHYDPWFPNKGK